VGRERAVDLVSGSGNGTPYGRAGRQPERFAEHDHDRRLPLGL
jgi:hypothetical protein